MSELYFQAEEAYKNKDYTKARKLLEKEYLEKKTFRTNYFLFLVFLKIEDYIAAYETANEYIRQYIIDNLSALADNVYNTIRRNADL